MKHYKWNKLFSTNHSYSVKTICLRLKRSPRTILENWKRAGLQISLKSAVSGQHLIDFLEKKFPSKKNKLNVGQIYCTRKKQPITINNGKFTIKHLKSTGKFQINAICHGDFCKEKLCDCCSKPVKLSTFIKTESAMKIYQKYPQIFDTDAQNKLLEIFRKGANHEQI